jgi:hypothetical protein
LKDLFTLYCLVWNSTLKSGANRTTYELTTTTPAL